MLGGGGRIFARARTHTTHTYCQSKDFVTKLSKFLKEGSVLGNGDCWMLAVLWPMKILEDPANPTPRDHMLLYYIRTKLATLESHVFGGHYKSQGTKVNVLHQHTFGGSGGQHAQLARLLGVRIWVLNKCKLGSYVTIGLYDSLPRVSTKQIPGRDKLEEYFFDTNYERIKAKANFLLPSPHDARQNSGSPVQLCSSATQALVPNIIICQNAERNHYNPVAFQESSALDAKAVGRILNKAEIPQISPGKIDFPKLYAKMKEHKWPDQTICVGDKARFDLGEWAAKEYPQTPLSTKKLGLTPVDQASKRRRAVSKQTPLRRKRSKKCQRFKRGDIVVRLTPQKEADEEDGGEVRFHVYKVTQTSESHKRYSDEFDVYLMWLRPLQDYPGMHEEYDTSVWSPPPTPARDLYLVPCCKYSYVETGHVSGLAHLFKFDLEEFLDLRGLSLPHGTKKN